MDGVPRRVGLVKPVGADQGAAAEDPQRPLHGALRQSGLLRDLVVAEAGEFLPLSGHTPPEKKIDEKGGGTVLVPDEVPQQHVDDVVIQSKVRHRYILYSYSIVEAPLRRGAAYGIIPPVGNTPMLKRIKFTTVYVADQDRALEFYTTKLGLKIFTDQPMGPDSRWLELQVPGAETMLVLWKQKDHTPGPMPAVVFVAANVQKAHDEMKAKGVEFVQPPTRQPWGESAMLKDSEGNLVMLGTE